MPSTRIHVEASTGPTPGENAIEIVERKGLGHPDTICDSVMEKISQALSKAYIEKFGRILHHNCDKGLLIAGQVEHRLGGGRGGSGRSRRGLGGLRDHGRRRRAGRERGRGTKSDHQHYADEFLHA